MEPGRTKFNLSAEDLLVKRIFGAGSEKLDPLPEHLSCVEEIVDPLPVQAEPQAWLYSEVLDNEPGFLYRRKYMKH